MAEDNDDIRERKFRIISDGELKKILEEHKKWVEHKEGDKAREGKLADLRDADLQGRDFSGVNLELANLAGCNLDGADLQGANLRGTSFQSATLNNANLYTAKLFHANFSHADLREANLGGADLGSADFHEARLFLTNLREARLYLANFQRVKAIQANFQKANLTDANLTDANLTGADLRGADLRRASLEGANVSNVKYNRRRFYRGIRVATCYGSPRFKRFAQDQDFIEEIRVSSLIKFAIYSVWLISSDCGRSLMLWATWSVSTAIFFGLKFFSLGPEAFIVDDLPWSKSAMIYYSVVTFTTLGFGDITPKTPGAAWWVMAEVILGYVMLGGLISIFATKLARRS